MKLKVFGLHKCSTCQKALAWFDENDISHHFTDVKETPLDPVQVSKWSAAVGGWEKMINRAGYTWRRPVTGRHGESYRKESDCSSPAQSFPHPPSAD